MKKITFEQAFSELESLAVKIKDENLELEQSLKYYEKAQNLINYCEKILSEAEQKITDIN